MNALATSIFQSTLPAREATLPPALRCLWSTNFNPRFPRGKRPPFGSLSSSQTEFQSTLPAREATFGTTLSASSRAFQSTLPAREATQRDPNIPHRFAISIHASREGSDIGKDTKSIDGFNFNPRFPRGKRHTQEGIHPKKHWYFNPRFPRGKRHKLHRKLHPKTEFQSTLPAREATLHVWASNHIISNFNPRFPRGKRQNSSQKGS